MSVIDKNYKTIRNDKTIVKVGQRILEMDYEKSYDRRYKDIAKKLGQYVDERNPEHWWEARVESSGRKKKKGTMDKFKAENGQELLDFLLPTTENSFSIFLFKKTGVAINNKNQFNDDGDEWYYILPACRDGFHRDWKHDGVCAQDAPKER